MINNFLLSKYASFLPTKLVKKIIKKKRIYFVKTDKTKLPKNNYPFKIKNKELAYKKMERTLSKAFVKPKVRKKTKPTKASQKTRLEKKKMHSDKKKMRKNPLK